MRCDFCGFEFDPSCNQTDGCNGCPVAPACSKITCPRCGYAMLPESKLIGWLRKLRTQKKTNLEKSLHENQ